MGEEKLRIVFMGTPEFAVPSLNILFKEGFNIVGVVTAPDKKAGRGRKISLSPVKEFALKHNLFLLQPEKLKDEDFLSTLKSLKADLQVVVAFRMLPKVVWCMPTFGTFNLHASLLPEYRGAAPINHAIINGEVETGLTTFFIDEEIDTGEIILQEKIKISDEDDFGLLHDRMMTNGAQLVLDTVQLIVKGKDFSTSQKNLLREGEKIKSAPKISKDFCKIDWGLPLESIYNFIRGLSPYPGAFTEVFNEDDESVSLKVFKTKKTTARHKFPIGKILTDSKIYLKVAVEGGFVEILELQLAGRRRMNIKEFLRGFKISDGMRIY